MTPPVMMRQSRRTLVVVPTYNESGTILELLDRVLAAGPDIHVLVVDDSSPDRTADLVRHHRQFAQRVFLLVRPEKSGLGSAYRAGFAWGLDRDYEAIVQIDADLSHPPERIGALIHALQDADVAVGSRYVSGGSVRNWSRGRRLLSRAANVFSRMVLGLSVHDATAGFKAFRRSALLRIAALDSEANGYCFQIENAWRAERAALNVIEVPISFVDRTAGTSKMSGTIAVEALLRVVLWRWRELTSREVRSFVLVGGVGYAVDVAAFNLFRSTPMVGTWDPSVARTLAVALAMCVTYMGSRRYTWPAHGTTDRRREVSMFVLANMIGFAPSLMCLFVSHDLLGLTSRLDDNVSANGVGLALGTVFRFFAYRHAVFGPGAGSRVMTLPSGEAPASIKSYAGPLRRSSV
jgi:dolichol-phosphate mannosyltransferase